jgi:hypothetical protein
VADFCSQHPGIGTFSVGAGQSATDYVIFPDESRMTQQPFTFNWPARGLAGVISDIQLPGAAQAQPSPSPSAPTTAAPTTSPTTSLASPSSFPLVWPTDMSLACAYEYGHGAHAVYIAQSPPSYSGACASGAINLGAINLDEFCPVLAKTDGYTSPSGPNGWWAGNPERYDQNVADQPWRDWRCYDHDNAP